MMYVYNGATLARADKFLPFRFSHLIALYLHDLRDGCGSGLMNDRS
jgi:hypothetical protein